MSQNSKTAKMVLGRDYRVLNSRLDSPYKFYGNRLRGFGVTGSPQLKTPFSILNVHRPYNSVSTTVLHCDCHDHKPKLTFLSKMTFQCMCTVCTSLRKFGPCVAWRSCLSSSFNWQEIIRCDYCMF